MSEAYIKGVTIDDYPKSRWSVKRLQRRQGGLPKGGGGGGESVVLFLGWHTPSMAEAEAEVEAKR